MTRYLFQLCSQWELGSVSLKNIFTDVSAKFHGIEVIYFLSFWTFIKRNIQTFSGEWKTYY